MLTRQNWNLCRHTRHLYYCSCVNTYHSSHIHVIPHRPPPPPDQPCHTHLLHNPPPIKKLNRLTRQNWNLCNHTRHLCYSSCGDTCHSYHSHVISHTPPPPRPCRLEPPPLSLPSRPTLPYTSPTQPSPHQKIKLSYPSKLELVQSYTLSLLLFMCKYMSHRSPLHILPD